MNSTASLKPANLRNWRCGDENWMVCIVYTLYVRARRVCSDGMLVALRKVDSVLPVEWVRQWRC